MIILDDIARTIEYENPQGSIIFHKVFVPYEFFEEYEESLRELL